MTSLLKNVLNYIYSDQSEPNVPHEFKVSVEECLYVHFLLTSLRRDINIISKCEKMFNYLHANAEYSRFFNQPDIQQIIEDQKRGIGRPHTRLGFTTFPFEWILWNLTKAFWINGYNIMEFLFITSNYPNSVITKEIITKALQYSKKDYGMKFLEEWSYLNP